VGGGGLPVGGGTPLFNKAGTPILAGRVNFLSPKEKEENRSPSGRTHMKTNHASGNDEKARSMAGAGSCLGVWGQSLWKTGRQKIFHLSFQSGLETTRCKQAARAWANNKTRGGREEGKSSNLDLPSEGVNLENFGENATKGRVGFPYRFLNEEAVMVGEFGSEAPNLGRSLSERGGRAGWTRAALPRGGGAVKVKLTVFTR